jgi:NADH dehydrogenase
VHLWYLVGFQNRLVVFIRWLFSFVTRGRAARLITTTEGSARLPGGNSLGEDAPHAP